MEAIKIVVEKIKAVSNCHTSGLYSDEEYRHSIKLLSSMLDEMIEQESAEHCTNEEAKEEAKEEAN